MRVERRDWERPALDDWADSVGATLQHAASGPVLAVAHSFGCLALARHVQRHPETRLAGALLVAPADPDRFGLASDMPDGPLPLDLTWIASTDDPWMRFDRSLYWARRWGCRWINLGAAGHINAEAGFGPLPLAARWVQAKAQKLQRLRHQRTGITGWSFAV